MYREILLDTEELKPYSFLNTYKKETEEEKENKEEKTKILKNLSNINIFIGANNSGKSRFLRTVFSKKNIGIKINTEKIKDNEINIFNKNLKKFNENINDLKENITDDHIYGIEREKFEKIDFIRKNETPNENLFYISLEQKKKSLEKLPTKIKPIIGDNNSYSSISERSDKNEKIEKTKSDIKNIQKLQQNIEGIYSNYITENIYIPTIRGLRGFTYTNEKKQKDYYKERTEKDYFKDGYNGTIYTGLSLYDDVKELLLGLTNEREKVKKFEKFLSENFFDNRGFTIIPNIKDNVVYVKIGYEKDYPIYELGDGIQAIIILTYPLFFNEGKKLKVFYEEPDMYLHPAFQRIFLETLMRDEFKDFQFFLTTHSNHFLDMTLDYEEEKFTTSIYTFQKKENAENEEFSIENVKSGNSNILELLGVRNSSVFLSNCTIWVEGITDRMYLRKYLEVFQNSLEKEDRHFKENIHYSFVEYGGNNITHWSFLEDKDEVKNIDVEKLCGKLFLISDKDDNDKERFKKKLMSDYEEITKEENEKLDEILEQTQINNTSEIEKFLSEINKISEKKTETLLKILKGESKTEKQKRQDKLENKLGDTYYCLDAKEIENIIHENILKEIIIKFEKDECEDIDFSKLKFDNYKDKALGKFIDENIENLSREYKDGNTIKDKVKFAKYAIEAINKKIEKDKAKGNKIKNGNYLTEEAIELTKKIYNFIETNNTQK